MISASGWMVSFRLLASLITSTLDIRPLMATLGWRIVAASSFRFFLLLPMCLWCWCTLVFVSVILPPSALFSVPTSLTCLPRWFSWALRFHSWSHFPIRWWGFFQLVFPWYVSFSLLEGGFLLAVAPSLWGCGFYFVCIGALLPLWPPSSAAVLVLYGTCCLCLVGGCPLTCFSLALFLLLCAVPYQLEVPVALTIPPPTPLLIS